MDIYLCGIKEFSDLSGVEYLPEERKERLYRYLRKEDKARCLVGGLMMRYVLGGDYSGKLFFGRNGKPYIKGGVYFNLSHSEEYVALAVCSSEVGVDIELVRPYSAAVAKKCYTAEEREWLTKSDDRAFYKLWTGKESIMKATGMGFSLSPESFSVLPVLPGPHIICGGTWYMQWYSFNDYEICAASVTEEEARIKVVDRGRLL